MNKADQLAKQLNELLLSQPEIQDYLKSREQLKDMPKLKVLESELKQMQKALLKARTDPQQETEALMQAYLKKREAFESHPLLVNYLNDEESAQSLLNYIKDYIEGQLWI